MAPKRNFRGGNVKAKRVKKAKTAKNCADRLVFNPEKGPLPNEILIQILLNLDPLSQHLFGVANHHFRQVFLNSYEVFYGKPYGYIDTESEKRFLPVKMDGKFDQSNKLPLKFRFMMKSWIPREYTWDSNSQKCLAGELKQNALDDAEFTATNEQGEIYEPKILRQQGHEEGLILYSEFKEANATAYATGRLWAQEAVLQERGQQNQNDDNDEIYDNASNTDYDSQISPDSSCSIPADSLLDEKFQTEEMPDYWVSPDLDKVEEPVTLELEPFEDPDDCFLDGGVVQMRFLNEN